VVTRYRARKTRNMEFVALLFEPLEEAPYAVEAVVPLDDEPLLFLGEFPKGGRDGDAPPPAEIEEVVDSSRAIPVQG